MKRQVIGGEYNYRGLPIRVEFMGPDFLAFADDIQVGQFWLDPFAADKAARKHVDATIEEERVKDAKHKS